MHHTKMSYVYFGAHISYENLLDETLFELIDITITETNVALLWNPNPLSNNDVDEDTS